MGAFDERAFALLVGVEGFTDPDYKNEPLPYAANDAADLGSTLVESLGWDSKNILLRAGNVTKADIVTAFRTIGDRARAVDRPELFLFYISTHGHPYKAVHRSNDVALATSDSSFADPVSIVESSLTRYLMAALIDTVPARQKAVVIDACFAALATGADELVAFDSYDLDAAVLASSTRRTYAAKSGRNSQFTACILDGIRSLTRGSIGLQDLFILVSKDGSIEPPYLDNKGRYILLGSVATIPAAPKLTADSIESFLRSELQTASERGASKLASDSYVPRVELQARLEQLVRQRQSPIVVVGPPGGGKTTFLVRSANDSLSHFTSVVWVSPADVRGGPAGDVLNRLVSPLGAGFTFTQVLKTWRPASWVLLLDGVNEWATSAADTKRLLREFADIAAACGASLIVSCREESWREFQDTLPTPTSDIVVSNFTDSEVAQIIAKMGRRPSADIASTLKRPLFLRMLLDAGDNADDVQFDVALLFERYVQDRAHAVAARYGLQTESVVDALRRVARWLERNGTETMPIERFLREVSELLSVGLLEEGICVRSAAEVGFESETLLEYLISLDLPGDPYADENLGKRERADPWWGAAAFKAARLEPRRVREVVDALADDWWTHEHALLLISRSSDPSFFAGAIEKIAGNEFTLGHTVARFLRELLDRYGRVATAIVLRAVRASVISRAGSWREKDWSKISPEQFAHKLSQAYNKLAPIVLETHLVDPTTTMNILVEWLSDDTYLADKEARVSDFAALFLKQLGWRDLDGLASAIEFAASKDAEMGYYTFVAINHVVQFIAQNRSDVSVQIVRKWMRSDHQALRLAASTLLPAVHVADTIAVLEESAAYVRRDDISEAERTLAISAIGSRKSRAALNCLASLASFEECQAGLIKAFRELATDFPDEAVMQVGKFNEVRRLRSDVITELINFYRSWITIAPEQAIALFEKVIAEHSSRYTYDIAGTVMDLSRPLLPISAFVEQQVQFEKSGRTLERYHYYLRKARPLGESDVAWVTRWIESGDQTYGLVSYLLNGELPYEMKAALYVRLDKAGALYENNWYELGEKALAFAKQFTADARFAELSGDGKIWLSAIARGDSSGDAARAVGEARYQDLMRRAGKRPTEEME